MNRLLIFNKYIYILQFDAPIREIKPPLKATRNEMGGGGGWPTTTMGKKEFDVRRCGRSSDTPKGIVSETKGDEKE